MEARKNGWNGVGRHLQAFGMPLVLTEGFEQRSNMTWILTGSLWPFCWPQTEAGETEAAGGCDNQLGGDCNAPGQRWVSPGW